eukprot:SAG11_NODE_3422_length_2457_cov_1.279050_2_plen_228_part_00
MTVTAARHALKTIRPLLREQGGAIAGLFLGDEIMAPYRDINDTVALVREGLGPGPLLYIICMQIFSGPGPSRCHGGQHKSLQSLRSRAEPCPQCWWPAVPSGLDLVGFDLYGDGANEVDAVKDYASRCLYPLLSPHQRFVGVPGTFADPSQPLGPQDELVAAKLAAYGAWTKNDSRIGAFNPWHYNRRDGMQPTRMVVRLEGLPRARAQARKLGRQLIQQRLDVHIG